MNENQMNIDHGKYPNAFYRVSAKAVIKNDDGKILAIKEGDDSFWGLPGGGIDHGETVHECLKRELFEELHITNDFTEEYLKSDSFYVQNREIWKINFLFNVNIVGELSFELGPDVSTAKFISIDECGDDKKDFAPLAE